MALRGNVTEPGSAAIWRRGKRRLMYESEFQRQFRAGVTWLPRNSCSAGDLDKER